MSQDHQKQGLQRAENGFQSHSAQQKQRSKQRAPLKTITRECDHLAFRHFNEFILISNQGRKET